MSSQQMADYLGDLRSNRVPRPNGSRPLPSSPLSARKGASLPLGSERPPIITSATAPVVTLHSRMDSDLAEKDSVAEASPKLQYRESGQRWMQRKEAHSLRRALEDMDLEEEQRLRAAAQDEASELVWKHQNPETPYRSPVSSYDYCDHLREGSYVKSLGEGSEGIKQQNSLSMEDRSSAFGDSPSNMGQDSIARNSCISSSSLASSVGDRQSMEPMSEMKDLNTVDKPHPLPAIMPTNRRRSSGSKGRLASGKDKNFEDSEIKIYEEPEEAILRDDPGTPNTKPPPPQVRRNPFARVQYAQERLSRSNSEPITRIKTFDRREIQKNPVSRSRNPFYMANPAPPTPPKSNSSTDDMEEQDENNLRSKDGIEIRGEDIRAATSMKMKDRSPKLPSPVFVTDNPGRPIVSFRTDWKPKEVELKGSPSSHSRSPERRALNPTGSTAPKQPSQVSSAPSVPTVIVLEPPTIAINDNPLPAVPRIILPSEDEDSTARNQQQLIPTITIQGDRPLPAPSIILPDYPPVPSISLPDEPPIPSISISSDPSSADISDRRSSRGNAFHKPIQSTTRPLPNPSTTPARPLPRHCATAPASSAIHYTPSIRSTTALCSQCALPISGRILSAAGSRFHPQCFVCHHCGEGLECVAFYPEPDAKRMERIDRIRRRLNGEILPGEEDDDERRKREMEDGDEGMRFYCHLDFHEFFSPRCGSCKTPIEGEVVVACGKEWHVGHFFCAQCGDPFDSSTPFVEKDGYAWCVNCHTNRYSAKCKKCRRPVTDTVVKALGAEWHAGCFCCVECTGPFTDGRYFLRGENQEPVCVGCEERRLKA